MYNPKHKKHLKKTSSKQENGFLNATKQKNLFELTLNCFEYKEHKWYFFSRQGVCVLFFKNTHEPDVTLSVEGMIQNLKKSIDLGFVIKDGIFGLEENLKKIENSPFKIVGVGGLSGKDKAKVDLHIALELINKELSR